MNTTIAQLQKKADEIEQKTNAIEVEKKRKVAERQRKQAEKEAKQRKELLSKLVAPLLLIATVVLASLLLLLN